MDKIREVFIPFDLWNETFSKEEEDSNIDYRMMRCLEYIKKLEFKYKSRDEEIEGLLKSCNNYKQMYVGELKEIKKLKNQLERLEYHMGLLKDIT